MFVSRVSSGVEYLYATWTLIFQSLLWMNHVKKKQELPLDLNVMTNFKDLITIYKKVIIEVKYVWLSTVHVSVKSFSSKEYIVCEYETK